MDKGREKPKVEKIWKDDDSILVALFKQLLYWGCRSAAVGLLDDAFGQLIRVEANPIRDSDGTDAASVATRESVMIMIGDEDGGDLDVWKKEYETDPEHFKKVASERVEECIDEDVFNLFA